MDRFSHILGRDISYSLLLLKTFLPSYFACSDHIILPNGKSSVAVYYKGIVLLINSAKFNTTYLHSVQLYSAQLNQIHATIHPCFQQVFFKYLLCQNLCWAWGSSWSFSTSQFISPFQSKWYACIAMNPRLDSEQDCSMFAT